MREVPKRWAVDEWALTLRLHQEGQSIVEIARRLDRTPVGVFKKMRAMGALPPRTEQRDGDIAQSFWSESEVDALFQLRDQEGLSWETIASRLGRSQRAVASKYSVLRGQKSKLWRGRFEGARASAIPLQVYADRDVRYEAAQRRTLTQSFFGDPPPGFSALDRRRHVEDAR